MDLAKYRNLFLDEAAEHLAEMGHALVALEKDPCAGESIDVLFRMAHSIKGMAASLGYDAITELAHRFEDRMDGFRSAGQVDPDALSALFAGLAGLERMVAVVRDTAESPPPADPGLLAALVPAPAASGPGAPKKKAPGRG